ncbi:MAG: hypothetical protein PHY59_08960 [Methanobacterium sp.]|nr:hypothetical protein [Methanobacterium sp.]
MDVDAKVTIIHMFTGIIAALISFVLTTGLISGINNEPIAILMAFVVLYISGQVSERIFGKEAVGGFKGWLWSGIVPFLFIWIVLWILLININPVPPIPAGI